MTSQKSTEIKVGIVAIIAIVLFIVGIILGKGLTVSTQLIKFRFPHSGGIQISAPLLVNGVKRGNVLTVNNDNGSVIIRATIDNVDDLKSDASGVISMAEITGGKRIEVKPGSSSQPLDKNMEIPGITAPDISDMISLAGDLAHDMKGITNKLDTMLTETNKLLVDGKVAENIESIFDKTNGLITQVNSFVASNFKSLEISLNNIKSISNQLKTAIDNNGPKVEALFNKLTHSVDSIQTLVDNSNSLIQKAGDITVRIDTLAWRLYQGDGLAARLINDKSLSADLDSTLSSLRSFVDSLRKHGINVNVRLGTRP